MISASASSAASSAAAPPAPCRSSSSSAAAGLENQASAVGRGSEVTGPGPRPGPRPAGPARPAPLTCQQRQQARAPAVRRDSGWRHLHLGCPASCRPREQARRTDPAPPPRGPQKASGQARDQQPVHALAASSAHCRPGGIAGRPAPSAESPQDWSGHDVRGSVILAPVCARTHDDVTAPRPPPGGDRTPWMCKRAFLLCAGKRASPVAPWPARWRRSRCRRSWRSS